MDFLKAENLVAQHGTPTLFISLNRIRENYRSLNAALPGVDLYYALKSNPLSPIVSALSEEGSFFDVCTNGEIDVLKGCEIDPSRVIHTHPIKKDHEIRYALDKGIQLFVVDNECELEKLLPYKDRAQILVRMSIQNPGTMVNLSYKFGVSPQKTAALIQNAQSMGMTVKGISFHAGSQNENNLKYIEALEYCRDICRHIAIHGVPLEIIDIGGGFPISYLHGVEPLSRFCQPINEYLERFFAGYKIIAEPGRVISGPAATLATRVVGKSLRDDVWWYYIDDGVYNTFSGKIFDHTTYPFSVPREGTRFASVIAGPTCDSIDVLYEGITLPALEVGDILLFDSMGAYTNVSSTNFNGYPKAKIVFID
ncbi:MAG: type III PLP-dependent enzyme [Chitinispirillaceae bacterium]